IPTPQSFQLTGGAPFTLTQAAAIGVQPGQPEVERIGEYLAHLLRPSTGFALPITPTDGAPQGSIRLSLGGDQNLGDEGYRLEASAAGVHLTAAHPAGLFRGVQ